jgi:bacillithiol biosynthesis deacetylase BshB1
MKLDILVFGAHPDDVELGCGGTIIKEVQNGKRVGVIDLTRGELGTRGSVKIRDAESKKASQIMGISLRDNMDFSDGFFENTKKNKILLVEKIRNYQPDIVITNALSDRHPDHSRGAQIVIDACFLSGLSKIDTSQDVWRPQAIYHYIQFNNMQPDFVVDISQQFSKKIKAVKSYSSQFYNPKSDEPKTIISSEDFLNSITYRAQDLGRQTNCKFAEGFISHQLSVINSFSDLNKKKTE